MGPVRGQQESLSSYRFRYAVYCGLWTVGLSIPLIVVWSYRSEMAGGFVGMFLLLGLPIGTGMALAAMVGFLIGSLFSRYSEQSPRAAILAGRFKATLGALVLAPVGLFSIYLAGQGVMLQSIPMFSRRITPEITFGANPVFFSILVAIWASLGVYILVFIARRLIQEYSRKSGS